MEEEKTNVPSAQETKIERQHDYFSVCRDDRSTEMHRNKHNSVPYTKKRHTYFLTKPFRCVLMYPHSQKQTTTRDILMDTDYL